MFTATSYQTAGALFTMTTIHIYTKAQYILFIIILNNLYSYRILLL